MESNFEFLKEEFSILFNIACGAEYNLQHFPGTALSKLRQLMEKTIDYVETHHIGPLTINQNILNKILFPVPPLEEQKKTVRRIESLFTIADYIESCYKGSEGKVDQLLQVILAKAFRGKLVRMEKEVEAYEEIGMGCRWWRNQGVSLSDCGSHSDFMTGLIRRDKNFSD